MLDKLANVVRRLTEAPQSGALVLGPFRSVRVHRGSIVFSGVDSRVASRDEVSVEVGEVLALFRCGDVFFVAVETSRVPRYATFVADPSSVNGCEVVPRLVDRYTVWRCDDGRTYSYMVDSDCQPIDKVREVVLRSEPIRDVVLSQPRFAEVTYRNALAFLETVIREVGVRVEEFGSFERTSGGGPYVTGPVLWRAKLDEGGYRTIELVLSDRGIVESHWDDYEERVVAPPGAYLVVSVPGNGLYTTYYAYARLNISDPATASLVEEAKRSWEEEKRRREEERRRKMEQVQEERRRRVEELLSDRDRLVRLAVSKAAEWADGVATYGTLLLVNVKKGRNGTMYSKAKWKPAEKDDALVEALKKVVNCENGEALVTRDGEILCTRNETSRWNGDVYILFRPVDQRR